MVAVGLVIGLALATLTGNGLQPQLYKTAVFEPFTYVSVAAVLILATMLASFVPAYRAATVDPSTALRYE